MDNTSDEQKAYLRQRHLLSVRPGDLCVPASSARCDRSPSYLSPQQQQQPRFNIVDDGDVTSPLSPMGATAAVVGATANSSPEFDSLWEFQQHLQRLQAHFQVRNS
jgi:hypothetical protein